jgi:hypothetical protein
MNEVPTKKDVPDDDWVVFIPDEEVRALERICNKMQQAQQELRKVAEAMGELRIES